MLKNCRENLGNKGVLVFKYRLCGYLGGDCFLKDVFWLFYRLFLFVVGYSIGDMLISGIVFREF